MSMVRNYERVDNGIESDHYGVQVATVMDSREEHTTVAARRVRPLCWHLPEAEEEVNHAPLSADFMRWIGHRRWTEAYELWNGQMECPLLEAGEFEEN